MQAIGDGTQGVLAMLFYKQNNLVQPYHVMRKPCIIIGRNPSASVCGEDEAIDVDLGPLTHFVSRKHLRIRYIREFSKPKFWADILGKNGVFINGDFCRTGMSFDLPLQCVIRFPSTDLCLSFIAIIESESRSEHSQSSVLLSSALAANEILENATTTEDANDAIPPTRVISPSGTISAFNSCPSSPRRTQFYHTSWDFKLPNPIDTSSPIPPEKQRKYVNDDIIQEGICPTLNIPEEANHSQDILPADESSVFDVDLPVWDPSIERDNSMLTSTLLTADDQVRGITVSSSANILDIHNTNAQMPPLTDDDSTTFLPVDDINFGRALDVNADNRIVTPENNLCEDVPELGVTEKTTKPSLSYVQLIAQAILSSPDSRLPLKKIYEYISHNHPHYKMFDKGWQNSIRHTLSLSSFFEKAARKPGDNGKGSLWTLSDIYHRRNEPGVMIPLRKKTKKEIAALSSPPLRNIRIAPAPAPSMNSMQPTHLISPLTNPLSVLSTTEAVPVVRPVTVLLGQNANGATYTVVPPQTQPIHQPQVVYLQCPQPSIVAHPQYQIVDLSSNQVALSSSSVVSPQLSNVKTTIANSDGMVVLTPVGMTNMASTSDFN